VKWRLPSDTTAPPIDYAGRASGWDASKLPNNIGTFATWWNSLGKGVIFDKVQSYYAEWDLDPKDARPIVDSALNLTGREQSMILRCITKEEHRERDQLGQMRVMPSPTTIAGKPTEHSRGSHIEIRADVDFESRTRTFIIYPTRYEELFGDQSILLKRFPDWVSGDFSSSFADLSKASAGMEWMTFDDLAKHLSETVNKGTEIIEVLGMKIPKDQILLWGLGLVVGMQLYFVLYLKRFSTLITEDDPSWNYPWIGLDESKGARSLFWFTVLIAPLAAVT
jgi:hypothetical protein